jgi:hypothetical protein
MEFEKWFKIKKYPHIGKPITVQDYGWVKRYVEDPDKIRKHSFLPLIHKPIVKRRFRPDSNSDQKRNESGKRTRKKDKPKVRHIFFSSHLDAMVLSKYNQIVSDAYEAFIEDKEYKDCIVAYRKIRINPNADKCKCNIDFAKSSFEFINSMRNQSLSVIVADVSDFFDSLDHKILKKQWCKILDRNNLPDDHYNIFKGLTQFNYVDATHLFESYNNTMIVECGIPNSNVLKAYKRKPIKSLKYSIEKNAVSYCEKDDFFKNNLNLIISKKTKKGIPQGSPISATLANVYMLEFDSIIYSKIKSINGFYQRYSDDLIIVCHQTHEDQILSTLRTLIKDKVELKIEPKKTKLFRFDGTSGVYKGAYVDEISKAYNYNRTLEYLGFSFDGQRVLIKTSGFSKFYRSMKSSLKKSASLAIFSKNPDHKLFKSRLYKRFSYKGAKRRLKFRPSREDRTRYVPSKEFHWGNYLSYIYKANFMFRPLNGGDTIKHQSRKFWKSFNSLLKFHENRINSWHNPKTQKDIEGKG